MRIKRSRNARDPRRDRKRHKSEFCNVDAYRLSGDVVVADCHTSAPRFAVDKHHQRRETDKQHHRDYPDIGILRRRHSDRTAQKLLYLARILRKHGSLCKAEVQTVVVHYEIEIIREGFHYFAEAERNDSQIVAAQPQNGYSDQHAENRRHYAAQYNSDRKPQPVGNRKIRRILNDKRKCTRNIRAHAHKARVTKRQLAEYSDCKIKRDRQYNIDPDRHEQTRYLIA